MNIVRKYGRANIQVRTMFADNEAQAFELECFLISELRESGIRLANLTDGGEGCSGRPFPEKSRSAFAKARGKDRKLSPEARKAILGGLAIGRSKLHIWQKSAVGQAHFKKLVAAGNAYRATLKIDIHCAECAKPVIARSIKGRFCGKICCQIAYRRRLSGRDTTS